MIHDKTEKELSFQPIMNKKLSTKFDLQRYDLRNEY